MPIAPATIAALRSELPGIGENLYLNHGYSGRSPVGVGERITELQRKWQRMGPGSPPAMAEALAGVEAARAAIAEWVGSAREAVALTPSTSIGLAIVIAGLPWQAGDELLTSDQEHVGLLTPIAAAASRYGLTVREFAANAPDPVAAVRAALTPRTRLVAFSEVLFTNGRLLPVPALAQACHERGALVLVDGAQSVGVLPSRPLESGADFYAGTCHKWLSGPEGTGFLLLAPEHLARGTVHPTVVGYAASDDRPGSLTQAATRYEGSTVSYADFASVPIALDFLRRGGTPDDRYARMVALARDFRARLRDIPGVRLLLEPDEAQQTSLVSWSMDGQKPAQIAARLLDDHCICIRTVPSPPGLRASFHFFNTPEEAERLAEVVRLVGEGVRE